MFLTIISFSSLPPSCLSLHLLDCLRVLHLCLIFYSFLSCIIYKPCSPFQSVSDCVSGAVCRPSITAWPLLLYLHWSDHPVLTCILSWLLIICTIPPDPNLLFHSLGLCLFVLVQLWESQMNLNEALPFTFASALTNIHMHAHQSHC